MGFLKKLKGLLSSGPDEVVGSVHTSAKSCTPQLYSSNGAVPSADSDSFHRKSTEVPASPFLRRSVGTADSAAILRSVTVNSDAFPRRPASARFANLRHAESEAFVKDSELAAATRVDSVSTRKDGRFETTIVERQGSRFVLQGVRTIHAESDDDEDGDGVDSPAQPGSGYGSGAPSRAGMNHVALASARSGLASGASERTPIASPGHGPGLADSGAGTPLRPTAAGLPGRGLNRVASLPMMLDGGAVVRGPAGMAGGAGAGGGEALPQMAPAPAQVRLWCAGEIGRVWASACAQASPAPRHPR
jgi:hypothetical protein